MDLFYSFNDAYAMLAGISIYSLLKNNKSSEKLRFFIVDSGISEKNRCKIATMIEAEGREIKFYNMPNFGESLGKCVDTGRWNVNVYSKLFVGSILPKDVHKIISIDCDTVVTNSLEELWNTDIRGGLVAGVNEAMSKYYRRYLGKEDSDYYLNSGMLMLNVDALRDEDYEIKFVESMKKYGSNIPYLDQDTINTVIPQNRILIVSPKFNAVTPLFCCTYKELLIARRASSYYSEQEFNEAKEDPYVIHFTTFFMNDLRPWFEGSQHPKLNIFLNYKKGSPWKDEPLWQDKRERKYKLKGQIIGCLPRKIACCISSILHGLIVPKSNYKKLMQYMNENDDSNK